MLLSLHFTTKHLFIMVLALMAGICWAPHVSWSLVLFGIIVTSLYRERDHSLYLILICCLFFFGQTRYFQNKELYNSHNHLLEKICNVTATVQEIFPRLDEHENICILLAVENVELSKKEYALSKKIYLFLPHYTTLFIKPGQKILVKNIIVKHPRSKSYQDYLIKEKIWAVAHPKRFTYSTLKKPALFAQLLQQAFTVNLEQASNYCSQLTQSLYASIFYGKKIKSESNTKIKELFARWGISHQLARSGLHLIILIGFLSFLFSLLPIPGLIKEWFIIGILYAYYLVTYPSVAFMRAFYMYVFYTLCKQLRVPSNPIHILLLATLLVLSINPHHLFFLDFQLSFSITALIVWFYQINKRNKTTAQ